MSLKAFKNMKNIEKYKILNLFSLRIKKIKIYIILKEKKYLSNLKNKN
jgi:hypothetical protein